MKKRTFLVLIMSQVFTHIYIPQNEGNEIVCKAHENFYKDNPPIPTYHLREMLRLFLKENSFQFNGKYYLQSHGTTMGRKVAVSFANIFMAHIETILSGTVFKPTLWKRYIDDIFSLWDIRKPANYQIHNWNICWDHVFRHGCIQRHKIQGKIYPWCKDTF